jgi:hypothetical protein
MKHVSHQGEATMTAKQLRACSEWHFARSDALRLSGTNDAHAAEHYIAGKFYRDAAAALGINNVDAALLSARADRIAKTLRS